MRPCPGQARISTLLPCLEICTKPEVIEMPSPGLPCSKSLHLQSSSGERHGDELNRHVVAAAVSTMTSTPASVPRILTVISWRTGVVVLRLLWSISAYTGVVGGVSKGRK